MDTPTEPAPQLSIEEIAALKELVAHLERQAEAERRREQTKKIGEVFSSHFSAEKIAALIAEMPLDAQARIAAARKQPPVKIIISKPKRRK
jgi:hypothetical protein